MDSSDFTLPDASNVGSRLLSESAVFLPDSHQDTTDLSLSDLSVNDHPRQHIAGVPRRPFSLLAKPQQRKPLFDTVGSASAIQDQDEEVEDDADADEGGALDQTMTQEDIDARRREAAKTLEEKLQHDLFVLRKLNTAFGVYKEALRETRSSTERVAEQLEHTDALLNKYMSLLSKSDKVAQLMLDERWQGAEADEAMIEQEHQAELEQRRKAEEERLLAEQRERERQERQEQERKEREDREEKERLQKERAAENAAAKRAVGRGSGMSGVRGTRASMRGLAVRGAPSTRGVTGIPRGGSSIPTVRGTPVIRRPPSSTGGRATTTRGIPRKSTRE